ncbi:hypothetical protein BV898_15390 [Hypsibius exemplaris]|uniref:Uncharacterized protein n=1 Tax=Hypsibius exemplaris TaxID=2072580 RepID=A0A9X6RKG1_HYPEX|nr:hypothetical protein BV898_15390 [Hypsibius exemplaris]
MAEFSWLLVALLLMTSLLLQCVRAEEVAPSLQQADGLLARVKRDRFDRERERRREERRRAERRRERERDRFDHFDRRRQFH